MQDIYVVMQQMHFRWFGHIERVETEIWVCNCRSLAIDGAGGRGTPHKTWNQAGLILDLFRVQLLHPI